MFLVVVDAHSKWPEVIQMSTTTATNTIDALHRLFSAYGLPQQLVSDNSPQFCADEFAVFCKMNGVKHIRCAPYHPASNGLAEWFVQTFKRAMKAEQLINNGSTTGSLTSRSLTNAHHMPRHKKHLAGCSWAGVYEPRLDHLRPNCADRVQSKQSQPKTTHDRQARARELELAQPVMTRNFRPGRSIGCITLYKCMCAVQCAHNYILV